MFGEHFRIVNRLSYSPDGNGLGGGFDVVFTIGVADISRRRAV